MGVFVTVNENVTNSDSTITWDTIWSLIPVEQISMGKVSALTQNLYLASYLDISGYYKVLYGHIKPDIKPDKSILIC